MLKEVAERSVNAVEGREQIERITNSSVLRNGPVLQRLLSYLGERTLDGAEVKESVIGVEVFGRDCAYDPKIDTIVRVQVHRLRAKLKDYYETQGTNDPLIIDIPRGGYHLIFQPRSAAGENPALEESSAGIHLSQDLDGADVAAQHPLLGEDLNHDNTSGTRETKVANQPASESVRGPRPRSLQKLWVGFLLGVIAGSFSAFLVIRANLRQPPEALAPSVRAFWSAFLESDSSPILVYPDATFLLDETNDLFRFRRGAVDRRGTLVDPHLARTFASNPKEVASAGPLYYENGYTGTGELESVAIISGIVTQLGGKLTVKPASELAANDLTQHNLIVLGSSFQSSAVRDLAQSGDFQFVNQTNDLEAWRGEIRNAKVQKGEQAVYQTERDPAGVLLSDYALVSIQPAIDGRHQLLLLGGLDTSGTKGATLFATSSQGIEDFIASGVLTLNKKGKSEIPLSAFQAVIRVDLQNGRDALHSQLIAAHRISSGRPDPLATKQ